MSFSVTPLSRPPLPSPIVAARTIVVVQLIVGMAVAGTTSIIGLLGLAWQRSDDSPVDGLAVLVFAAGAVLAALLIASTSLAFHLTRGRPGPHRTLIGLETVLSLGLLTLTRYAGSAGTGSFLAAPLITAGCGVAVVVLLLVPATRGWAAAH